MKTCRICNKPQALEQFSKSSVNTDGYKFQCKTCDRERHRTYEGKLLGMYHSQCASSKKRKHPAPAYVFEEFKAWAESNGYADLYQKWVTAGYEWRSAPSADRLKNDLPYTLDNIRLTTWKINEDKAHTDRKTGDLVNNHTPVKQLTKSGKLIKIHLSQAAASKATGIPQGNICQTLKGQGRRKTAGGFKWEYAN